MTSYPFLPHVLSLPPIDTGAEATAALAARGITDPVLLNSNEGPYGPFPEALDAMDQAARGLNRYPHPIGGPLLEDLARFYEFAPEQVIVDGGSVNLLFLVATAFIGPGDEVVFPWPSFPIYHHTTVRAQGTPVPVPLKEFRNDVDALLAAITPRTKVVMVCTPNNPTGPAVSREELDRFMDRLPEHVVAVVDEAYAEFAPDFADGFPYVRAGQPVLVLRTFSKVYGLAGARVGYGIGPAALIEGLRRAQLAFPVNQLAVAAARASLPRQGIVKERYRLNRAGLEQLYRGFERLGLAYVPSATNFVLVDVGDDSFPVFQRLFDEGVLVRPGRGYQLPRHLRVTVGLPEENDRFLAALARALGQ